MAGLESAVFRLDELVASQPTDALRSDVQDLRGRMDALKDRIAVLEKRLGRGSVSS